MNFLEHKDDICILLLVSKQTKNVLKSKNHSEKQMLKILFDLKGKFFCVLNHEINFD